MKSGIVTLAGRSNVGKSTLLNALVGTKVAITSPKPQTTRDVIRGILNDPRGQIVFMDTPGVFEADHGPLTQQLNQVARKALSDVDAIVYVVDPTRAIGTEEHRVHAAMRNSNAKKILVYNKSDLSERERPYRNQYHDLVLGAGDDTVVAEFDVSGLKRRNLNRLVDALFDILPEGEPLYEEGRIADIPQKFWVAELIREKVFLRMQQEIPYSVAVEVDEITAREDGMLYIAARIMTTHDRYRKMLIGAGGRRIKEIGSLARKELETAMNRKVFLELNVEARSGWQR
ncbi:GTPase Era [Candidatus Uhrbacteria bacterium]|nr:GTPase Era [Candidatus Uhrbacteria bacterium]